MFQRLFAESGLSLERLRALVEVGAHGSIVKAAEGDAARQSLYSRQLKELESFFQASLVERHGRGVRLTSQGRELARISRFFLLGLSNFQRGCLAEGQSYRLGADTTFSACFLIPLVSQFQIQPGIRFRVETVFGAEVERRLHDLTLDFGIVKQRALSRPLQTKQLGAWRLKLWVPRVLCKSLPQGMRAFRNKALPLAWPTNELDPAGLGLPKGYEPALMCDDFLAARAALKSLRFVAFLPEFLPPGDEPSKFFSLRISEIEALEFSYALAWNPRLLRLNPHAARRRDALIRDLSLKLYRASQP
jgi:DNA-binding transcriptional LysR family regulator